MNKRRTFPDVYCFDRKKLFSYPDAISNAFCEKNVKFKVIIWTNDYLVPSRIYASIDLRVKRVLITLTQKDKCWLIHFHERHFKRLTEAVMCHNERPLICLSWGVWWCLMYCLIGLYSERPRGAGFRSVNPAERWRENPARALARAGFSQHLECGIHRSESSPEGSFALIPHSVARWAKTTPL